ncbi:hypothetical protein FFLO_05050 [Filobasidium floriforme]|uniref:Acetoacetate decarboxylase n=1 Tax=Filobasidium floriforme TaxID=5210 RepID=A0A8K0JIA2_9TREE|nr:uncharacterized protein HD553DRAFT_319333 [Filobasidium floriforme]KAG7530451.1 hypothetical protein FFLO_05050 [Filobasidium floriforme]KAH8078579.1 hypothetical protein HD553DRAFT_319333 [Filobasidium floriforme]
MLNFEKTGLYHRAPVGFGPAASPRQGPDGKPFNGWKENSEMHLTGIVLNVERAQLQALLPEGYDIAEDVQPTILFEVMNLRKLPWLAGRGYNTWGIYANDVICRRSPEPIRASYMVVLFESFTDPISTGREELGFSKVWAELPDPKEEDGKLVHTASWFGTEFLRMEIPKIASKPVEESPAFRERPFTMPSVQGTLHHRYIPAVGEPGKHDASYATYMPGGGSKKPTVLSYRTTEASLQDSTVKVTPHKWEDLPSLYPIVNGLASLQLGEVREVAQQVFLGASDCSGNKRVEW